MTSTVTFFALASSTSSSFPRISVLRTLYRKSARPLVLHVASCSSRASHLTIHFHSLLERRKLSFSCRFISSKSVMLPALLGGCCHLIPSRSHRFCISSSSPPHPQNVLGYPLMRFISEPEKLTMPPKYLGLLEYRSQTRAIWMGVLGNLEYHSPKLLSGRRSTSWKINTSRAARLSFLARSNPILSNFPRLNLRPSSDCSMM
mmetsp:Transcript_12237/g.25930  ORF Transcript_12237/g.25930 Transcript_12237/m.25930 type:complete len:203 (-) Transcript_12237:632-1240(-)